jgi:hypothetical protein
VLSDQTRHFDRSSSEIKLVFAELVKPVTAATMPTLAKVLRLDFSCCIADSDRDQIHEAFRQICAAGGDVECGGEVAFVVVERGCRARKQRISRIEMLITMNCQCAALDETCTDAVRTFALLAPHGPSP